MTSSWQADKEKLTRQWSDAGKYIAYSPQWMQDDALSMRGSYLPPVPAFASHSPFGGPSWFELHCPKRSSE